MVLLFLAHNVLHLLAISHVLGFLIYFMIFIYESLGQSLSGCFFLWEPQYYPRLQIRPIMVPFYNCLFCSHTSSTCSESVFTLVCQLGLS